MRVLAFFAGMMLFGSALVTGLIHNDAQLNNAVNVSVPLLQSYAIPILIFGFPILVLIVVYSVVTKDEEKQ